MFTIWSTMAASRNTCRLGEIAKSRHNRTMAIPVSRLWFFVIFFIENSITGAPTLAYGTFKLLHCSGSNLLFHRSHAWRARCLCMNTMPQQYQLQALAMPCHPIQTVLLD